MELMGNSGIGIALKKIGIDKFGIGVCYKKNLNPQINLPFIFLIEIKFLP